MPGFDPEKFECIHQVGGIRTARYDWPDAGGSPGCRVALVDTGCGLRFTVALDRGGDIVEAFFGHYSLAYLTPNGYKPPVAAPQKDDDWLSSWPGGLVTTCGPRYIGPGREEDGQALYLHGPYSNTPAALLSIRNPEPRRGDMEMYLELSVRDTRMYGPVVEVRRRIEATLGQPVIRISDEVINQGNTEIPHNWLYHVNFGYPLVDGGAEIVGGGQVNGIWDGLDPPCPPTGTENLNAFKNIPDPLPEHAGTSSRGLLMDIHNGANGTAQLGVINRKLGMGVALSYDAQALPRLANWQHYGPGGAYVTALEPFSGSLFGKFRDDHPLADGRLAAGASKHYALTLAVHTDDDSLQSLKSHDQDLISSAKPGA